MKVTLRELGDRFGGTVAGHADTIITGVGSLETASTGDIAFAERGRYHGRVASSRAAAIVVPEDFPPVPDKILWRVARPRETFVRILGLFYTEANDRTGIHASAVIAADAALGEAVTVCEHAVIRDQVRIGRATMIESNVHIGAHVEIGEDCWIGPNASLLHGVRLGNRVRIHAGAVIGGDGFGYQWIDDRQTKVPSFGSVQIDDDVEIGCNACIDRATFGVTRVRRGAKIDNLVQVAHNNDIGEDAIIVSQVGLSGTVKVGKRATLAGQVGVADHVSIGDGSTVAAASGVSKNVAPGEIVWGFPARPIQRAWRELASLARLPEALRKLRLLESRFAVMEQRLNQSHPE